MGRSIDPIGRGARRDAAVGPHPALIVSMSLRPGIPWRVALQQSPLPLPRLELSCDDTLADASPLQQTATCPFFCGLTKRPHSIGVHPWCGTAEIGTGYRSSQWEARPEDRRLPG